MTVSFSRIVLHLVSILSASHDAAEPQNQVLKLAWKHEQTWTTVSENFMQSGIEI